MTPLDLMRSSMQHSSLLAKDPTWISHPRLVANHVVIAGVPIGQPFLISGDGVVHPSAMCKVKDVLVWKQNKSGYVALGLGELVLRPSGKSGSPRVSQSVPAAPIRVR